MLLAMVIIVGMWQPGSPNTLGKAQFKRSGGTKAA